MEIFAGRSTACGNGMCRYGLLDRSPPSRRPDFTDKLLRLLIILSFTVAFHGLINTPSACRAIELLIVKIRKCCSRNGIDAPPGSAARMQFESRLESTEPIGPYALTNSLAGFLVSGLLLGIATLFESTRRSWQKPWNWIILAQYLLCGLLFDPYSQSHGMGCCFPCNTWLWHLDRFQHRLRLGSDVKRLVSVSLSFLLLIVEWLPGSTQLCWSRLPCPWPFDGSTGLQPGT